MSAEARKIDCHTHFYPSAYLKEMRKRTSDPLFGPYPGHPYPCFSKDGEKFASVRPPHTDIELRLREMDKYGMDMQALTLTCPAVDIHEPELALKLARIVNDEFAGIHEKYPERFVGIATLPLQSMDDALDELDRAIGDLGLRGLCVMSNYGGKHLYAPEFWPLYERAAKLDVPIIIHPNSPVGLDALVEAGVFKFIVDSTISITRLILDGVLEKYPTLKFVVPHMGSMVPYFQERLDSRTPYIYETTDVPEWYIPPELETSAHPNLKKPPSEYFKQVYLDTVSFYPPALKCAYDMAGPDHLVLGSDYPHFPVGDLRKAIKSINDMNWSKQAKEKIYGLNAARLLKIT